MAHLAAPVDEDPPDSILQSEAEIEAHHLLVDGAKAWDRSDADLRGQTGARGVAGGPDYDGTDNLRGRSGRADSPFKQVGGAGLKRGTETMPT